jgi:hypothetical protein
MIKELRELVDEASVVQCNVLFAALLHALGIWATREEPIASSRSLFFPSERYARVTSRSVMVNSVARSAESARAALSASSAENLAHLPDQHLPTIIKTYGRLPEDEGRRNRVTFVFRQLIHAGCIESTPFSGKPVHRFTFTTGIPSNGLPSPAYWESGAILTVKYGERKWRVRSERVSEWAATRDGWV